MAQKEPDGDGLPYQLLPYSKELGGLFLAANVFCVRGDYSCEECFRRNVCMKKLLWRLKVQAAKRYKRNVEIAEVLKKQVDLGGYWNGVVEGVREYVLKKLCGLE